MTLRLRSGLNRIRLTLSTVYYLKPRQLYYRALYRLRAPVPYRGLRLSVRSGGGMIEPIARANSYARPGRFTFMNHTITFQQRIDWNADQAPRLWLYNLHYFDFLQSRYLRNDKQECLCLIKDWIATNPCGVGQGWDAYPLSLRIVNWIKWSLQSSSAESVFVDSLTAQAHRLHQRVEHQLMANHVLANAKALVFAGVFLQGNAADTWLKHGLQLLSDEHQRQILEDGGHCERSPMYHAIMLEDVLDLINLAQAFPQQISVRLLQQWQALSEKMQVWLNIMTHPDGEIAFFNDATQKFSSSPRAVADYAHRLGVLNRPVKPYMQHLEDTGFIRCEESDAVLIGDVGGVGPSYQPGHAHAGTLSLEFSLSARRVLVNSGISTYAEGPLRQAQRSTCAHNTLVVNGENSSEVWASFRVARRARTNHVRLQYNGPGDGVLEATDEASLVVSAEHDGYRFIRSGMVHHREIRLCSDKLVVSDRLSRLPETAQVRYYLHPDVCVEEHQLVLPASATHHRRVASWRVSGAVVHWEHTHWHPELGLAIDNVCLVATLNAERCEFTLDWSD